MDYISKYNKYYKKYNNLKQRGSGNLAYNLTSLFIELYFEYKNFNEVMKDFEFQLQNYVNKLKIPIKYENGVIYVLKNDNTIYSEIKIPKYYLNENTFFQENTMHGEPYIINFLSIGINMYYRINKPNEEKLPYLLAGLICYMGKSRVKLGEGTSILNRNDKNHQKFRDEDILKNLNLIPEDLLIVKKTLGQMNKSILEDSRIMRFEIIKMIEKHRTERNEDVCNSLWKLVTSNLYDYSQNFTLKDNIFRSRNERTNDEIKQLVNDNIRNYNLKYTDIIKFCLNVKDETNVKLNKILEKIFNQSIKPDSSCSELGKDACGENGVWNTKNGKITGNINSPVEVTYFANLLVKFLNRFFPEIRAFVVGEIFPSYFTNDNIKDYNFVMLSNIKDFRNLLLPIIFLFCQFCEVAQGVGKLPSGNIVIKDESKNGNDRPRNFNIRIDVPNFEGLDIVLPRDLEYDKKNKNVFEQDINMEGIKDINDEQQIREILITDLKRRECYLNALYGEMSYNIDKEESEINIFNYLPQEKASNPDEKQMVKNFNNSLRNWQEFPTDGLDTFISDYFRVIRIFKMYLNKFYDGEPSISLLNENMVKVLEYYNQQNRDIIYHSDNGIFKMIDLLKNKIELLNKRNYNSYEKIEIMVSKINKFGEYLYKLSFIFFIINQKLEYESQDKNVLPIKDIYEQKISNLDKVLNIQREKISDLKQISYGPSTNKYLNKQEGEVNLKKVEKFLTFIERTRLFNEKSKRNKFFYINSSVTLEIFLQRFRLIMRFYLKNNINQDEMLTMLLSSYLLPHVSKEETSNKLYKSKIKDTHKIIEKLKSQFTKPIKKYKIRSELKDEVGIARIHKILDRI